MNAALDPVFRTARWRPVPGTAYSIGIAAVVAAVLLRLVLASTIGTSLPVAVHVIAVFMAVVFGGARAAAVAVLLSAMILLLGPMLGGPMAASGSSIGRLGQVVLLVAASVIPILLVLAMRAALVEAEALRRELLRTRGRLEDALVAGAMGTFDYSVEQDEAVWDENAYRLWDVAPGTTVTADRVRDRVHPADLPAFDADMERVLDPDGDGLWDVTYRTESDDGGVRRWVRSVGRVEFDPSTRKPVRIVGTNRDRTAEMQAQAQREVLLDELRHRVKNLSSVAEAILSMSHREATSKDEALSLARGRLDALARAHSRSLGHADDDLRSLVEAVLAPMGSGRVNVKGPPTIVPADRLTDIGMVLHELATNATKHGALSVPEGTIDVSWTTEGSIVRLLWRERGGASLPDRTEAGFGSRLLTGIIRQIGGSFARVPREDGLDVTLEFPTRAG